MNLYKFTVTYSEPKIAEVVILARDPDHAISRLKSAVNYDDMPAGLDFKIASAELIQEDVPVDEDEMEAMYDTSNKKVLN